MAELPINRTQHPIVARSKEEFGRYGPAMNALSHKEQEFVEFLMENGGRRANDAGAKAGYHPQYGWKLARQEHVQKALKEESIKRLGSYTLMATSVVAEIAMDDTVSPRVRLTAAEMIMNRTGLHAKSEHVVKVENVSVAEMLANVKAKAAALGLDGDEMLAKLGYGPGEIVDAEFEEVGSTEGLEDVL
jgi:hypothetical protein